MMCHVASHVTSTLRSHFDQRAGRRDSRTCERRTPEKLRSLWREHKRPALPATYASLVPIAGHGPHERSIWPPKLRAAGRTHGAIEGRQFVHRTLTDPRRA